MKKSIMQLSLTLLLFCFSYVNYAQRIIEGKVLDSNSDETITGAMVFIKNTPNAVYTNNEGAFKIEVPEDVKTLMVSASGYQKQEVEITSGATMVISLMEFSSLTIEMGVIGSRDQTKSKSEAPVAVDIIPVSDVISKTGFVELNQIMQYAAPSFNVNRQSGGDLADHVDPSSLRGLGPDQVLFLVNGKRYHSSSIINVFGVRGRGNAGFDMNSIPASSVERIEVLKDGAAAQYGSDAVAGVINIVLKENQTGTSGSMGYGSNVTGWGSSLNYANYGKIIPFKTDGGMLNANVTHGFKVGKGNLSVTADYLSKSRTLRPNNEIVFEDKNYRNGAGDAAINTASLFFSGHFPLAKGEIYTFGGYSHRKTDSYIWTIAPDDTTRNVYEIHPKGFDPHLVTSIGNLTTTVGYKTKVKDWDMDFGNTYGFNAVEIENQNSLNPSLLTKSPTNFKNGAFKLFQNSTDIDFTRKFKNVMQGLNVAFGAEYRIEDYEIEAGEEASWKTYENPTFQLTDPTTGEKYNATKVGTSQGYPGFRPSQAVDAHRSNTSIYVDAELDVTQKLLIAGALRYENYSDFGGAFGGKFAARYKAASWLNLRTSLQTGFRAPSLAQVYFQSTINDVDANGNSFEKVIFNNRSDLTKRLGIPNLTAENSVNYGFGAVISPSKKLSFSIDGYMINVYNRILLSGTFKDDDDVIGQDIKDFKAVAAQFYSNALDTKTVGLDITGTYKTDIGEGRLNVTLGGNFNNMESVAIRTPDKLKGKEGQYLSSRELQMILSSAPKSKFHLTADYKVGKLGVTLRNSYFSSLTLLDLNSNSGNSEEADALRAAGKEAEWREFVSQKYTPRLVTDLIFNYELTKKVALSVGGNNIFDVYPTIQDPSKTDSGTMWDGVQMGSSGAYFFTKLICKF
jgi:iron complex outermembrane recepter protein